MTGPEIINLNVEPLQGEVGNAFGDMFHMPLKIDRFTDLERQAGFRHRKGRDALQIIGIHQRGRRNVDGNLRHWNPVRLGVFDIFEDAGQHELVEFR